MESVPSARAISHGLLTHGPDTMTGVAGYRKRIYLYSLKNTVNLLLVTSHYPWHHLDLQGPPFGFFGGAGVLNGTVLILFDRITSIRSKPTFEFQKKKKKERKEKKEKKRKKENKKYRQSDTFVCLHLICFLLIYFAFGNLALHKTSEKNRLVVTRLCR